ncbi:hypothetical protein DTO169C6_7285 [Paecilomyces variotii]|nr:hypothetical protein DTO169C6_7285 [Paecilomyces variotii]
MSTARPQVFRGRNYYPHNVDSTDFRISCQGRLFWVHKDIISRESPYFQTLVRGTFSEGQNGRLTLRDIQPDVVHALLAYMYTGKLQLHLVHSPPEYYSYTTGKRLDSELADWDKNEDYMGTVMSKAFACVLIYIAADRFFLDNLKELAARGFMANFRPRQRSDEIPDDFVELIGEIYEKTHADDDALKSHVVFHLNEYLSQSQRIVFEESAFKEAFLKFEKFAWDIFSGTVGTWGNECDLHRRATGYLRHVIARETGLIETLQTNTECRQCGHEFGCVVELVGKDRRRIEKEAWLRCTKCKTRHFPPGFPLGRLY